MPRRVSPRNHGGARLRLVVFTTEEFRRKLAIANHRGATEGFTEGGLSAARLRLMIYHHRVATEGFTEESRRGLAGGSWFFTTEVPQRVSRRKHGGGSPAARGFSPQRNLAYGS